jgi:hypothetical protein
MQTKNKKPTTMRTSDPKPTLPTLPQNITIFSPTNPIASQNLLASRIFTKLATSATTAPSQLKSVLSLITTGPDQEPETFVLPFRKGLLIFDGPSKEHSQEELTDAHHTHFRAVCLALKDADISLDFSACIFDAENLLGVGFQVEGMKGGEVLVVDLLDGEDESEEDSDEDEEVTVAKLRALVGGGTVAAQ